MRLTLAGRLSLLVTLISLAVFSVVWGLYAFSIYVQAERRAEAELRELSESFIREKITVSGGVTYFRRTDGHQSVADWLRERNLSALITGGDGARIAGFGIYRNLNDAVYTAVVRPAVVSASDGGGQGLYRDITFSLNSVYDTYTVPLREGNRTVGYLQIAKEAWLVRALIAATVSFGIIAAGLSAILTSFVSFFVIRHALAPLRQLVRTLKTFDQGGVYHSIRIENHVPEVETLIHAFNTMLKRVSEGIIKQKRFIDHASHELKTPLTRVMLLIDRAGRVSGPRVRNHLQVMEASIAQVSRSVDSLLSLSEVSEKRSVRLDVVAPGSIIGDIVEQQVKGSRIRAAVSVPRQLRVKGNSAHFRILFANIISNAVKYTPTGSVTVTARVRQGRLSVTVKDTGIGIPSEDLPRIFDRFFRSRNHGSQAQGTGLGLSIVQEICHRYGYTVAVHSKLNKGTSITVGNIPLA